MKTLIFITLFITNIFAYSTSITVGILKFAPPFSSPASDGNQYFGFTIDLMDAICKRINEKCRYKAIDMDKYLDALDDGSITVAFLPIPVTSGLPADYIYSLPYLTSNGQFLARDNHKIKTIVDIKGKKIGVVKDTLFETIINSNFAGFNTIKGYDGMPELLSALTTKEVDVIYLNASIAKYIINNAASKFKFVGNKILMGSGYAMIANKNQALLIKKINFALLEMESEGSYIKIYKKYFSD